MKNEELDCNIHENEMKRIRSEFGEIKKDNEKFKTEIHSTFDKFMVDVLNKIKPPFSISQIVTWLGSFLISLVAVVIFINSIKNDGQQTEYRVTNLEEYKKIQGIQYELTQEKLNTILTRQAEDRVRMENQNKKDN